MKEKSLTHSYQTRFSLSEKEESVLSEMAELLSRVKRSLCSDVSRSNERVGSFKNDYLKRFSITARQFNACRVSLEGNIASQKTLRKQAISDLKQRVESLEKEIARLKTKPSKHFAFHQKKRRFHR